MTALPAFFRNDLSTRASAAVLAVLIAASVAGRDLAARGVRSPWIFPDEFIYASLARSVGHTGSLAIRGVHTTAYSVVYPVLLSPSFLGRDPASAYAAVKLTNAILMSLAAIPAFLLARRLLNNALSLVAAALALLVPSMMYTGLVLTENAFYPVLLTTLLLFVRALEHPSLARQAVALAAIPVAFLTRAQAVVLVPILLLAIVLQAVCGAGRGAGVYERDVLRSLKAFLPTGVALVGAAAAVLLAQGVRGKSPTGLFGHYADQVHGYPLASIPRWFVYHLADLELYLGILPFVPAAIVAATLLWRPGIDPGRRAFGAVSAAASACLLLLAATVSSQPASTGPLVGGGYPPLPQRLHERYTFYVAALWLMLFLHWLRRRREFSSRALVPLLAVGIALPLALPYGRLLTNANFEALALIPWHNTLIAARNVPTAMAVTVAVVSTLLLFRRGSIVLLQVGFVAATMWFTGLVATSNSRSASTKVPSSRFAHPTWIDAAVPPGTKVAALWAPPRVWSPMTVIDREDALWRAEFFNYAVEDFYYLRTPMHYALPQRQAQVRNGVLVLPPGSSGVRYVIADGRLPVAATPVARNVRARVVLYRLRRPAVCGGQEQPVACRK